MKQEIKDIIVQLKEISIAEKQVAILISMEHNYIEELDLLNAELDSKYSKIDSLTKLSFLSLYHKLLGTSESKLELLKKHYLELSLDYNELSKSVEHIGREIDDLEAIIEKQEILRAELNHQIQLYENDLQDPILNNYRTVAIQTSRKISLLKEIEEAIDQGVIVNRKFNKVINFIKNKAKEIYNEVNDKEYLENYEISNISKYQELITSLKHSLVKLEIELSDVYKEILDDNEYSNPIVANFMDEYRMNLIWDLTAKKTMNGSFIFLKKFKSIIMSTTRSLRSDLRSLKKELIELEEQESNLLSELQK